MELDPGKALRYPIEAAKFIGSRLLGGAWAELPHPEPRPAKPPQRLPKANIQFIHMGD